MNTRWNIDPSHSVVGFAVRHMVISKTRGRFGRWQGTLDYDPARPSEAKVEVTIDASSVETHEPKRDAHLRSADFFDVERFPELTFKSTAIAPAGEGFRVTGELTIRGVTKTVVLDAELGGAVKDPWGKQRASFSATTQINRKDFGLTWNQALETGGLLVGEKVEIEIELEAVQAQSASQAA